MFHVTSHMKTPRELIVWAPQQHFHVSCIRPECDARLSRAGEDLLVFRSAQRPPHLMHENTRRRGALDCGEDANDIT